MRVMLQLPQCGWRIYNTLITPALLQQGAAGLASILAYTVVPLIEQAFRSETSEGGGVVTENVTAAVNATG